MLAYPRDDDDQGSTCSQGGISEFLADPATIGPHGMTAIARRSLRSTSQILTAFEEGKDLAWICQLHTDLYALGTAFAIWTLASRRLCEPNLEPQDILVHAARAHLRRLPSCPDDPAQTRLTRDHAITLLKEIGLLGKRQNLRDIKTVSTVASIAEVASEVARSQRVCVEDIASIRRSREIARARFIMIYVLRNACGHSLNFIGRNLGARDHTTILSGLNTITLRMRQDDAIRKTIMRICHDVDLIALQRFRRQVLNPSVVSLRRQASSLDHPQ